MKKINITADTPLSALFVEGCHDEFLKEIQYLRDFTTSDDPTVDNKHLCYFEFNFDDPKFGPCKVYQKLANMISRFHLRVSQAEFCRYMADHSNLHASAASIYRSINKYV